MTTTPKTSRVKVFCTDGVTREFELIPAESRTHYGSYEHGIPISSGGVPYAYATTKKGKAWLDDAWLVKTSWSGSIVAILIKWGDGEWTTSKIESSEPTPDWLVHKHAVPRTTIYNMSCHLRSGKTRAEALARV